MPSLDLAPGELLRRTQAMATEITVRLVGGWDGVDAVECEGAMRRALRVFVDLENCCSRFDPASALMRANARPDVWHHVPPTCFDALHEAWCAYELTGGRFDPRVLTDLVALGYDRSLPFAHGPVALATPAPSRRLSRPPWSPLFRPADHAVRLGGFPVDLGGIGKGLAVRGAGLALRRVARDFVINAGGDCYCAGHAPEGGPWLVGVEDPAGGPEPIVVIGLCDQASATSSTRVRHWSADGVPVHHLIDPSSGLPGGRGLVAVTVVAPDPAIAEVWSKVLFLAGPSRVAAEAARASLAACWVSTDSTIGMSPEMERFVTWRRR